MNPNERRRFMASLNATRGDAILIDDVIAEMNKLDGWKQKFPPRSIERAYVSAHEVALCNLVKSSRTRRRVAAREQSRQYR